MNYAEKTKIQMPNLIERAEKFFEDGIAAVKSGTEVLCFLCQKPITDPEEYNILVQFKRNDVKNIHIACSEEVNAKN